MKMDFLIYIYIIIYLKIQVGFSQAQLASSADILLQEKNFAN